MYGALLVFAMFVPGPLGQPGPQPSVPVIRATGVGHPPPHAQGDQARLMARRAAEVQAVRNLATKLGYGRRATVRGFRYASTTYRPDGSVEVVVEYPIGRVADSHGRRQAGTNRPLPREEGGAAISRARNPKDRSPKRHAKSTEVRRLVRVRTRPGCPPWP